MLANEHTHDLVARTHAATAAPKATPINNAINAHGPYKMIV